MTGEERIEWAWEGALLLDLARKAREEARRREQRTTPSAGDCPDP